MRETRGKNTLAEEGINCYNEYSSLRRLQVIADLAAISPVNLIIILGFIGLIIGALLFFLHRQKNITIGPFTLKKEQENQSAMFYMNADNAGHDEQLQIRLRSQTSAMRTRLVNVFQEYNLCSIMYSALASAIRWPLYESIVNNHFTEVLSPDNIADYKKRIFGLIEDEYRNIFSASLRTDCSNDDIPDWDTAKAKIQTVFCQWVQYLLVEVIRTCNQKLDTYKRYLPNFTKNDDDYRGGIIKQCIEKNERYIRDLSSVLEQEKRNAANN
jgi:hypothetical protein